MIDLNTADQKAIVALSRLKEPFTAAFLGLLYSELEAAKKKLVYAGDMAQIHRLQGRAEAFEDLLRAAEESADVLRYK